jgi:alpha-tubulin suppressor-like RCC1 family protein
MLLSLYLDDGYLWMWGWGSRGQLGQGEKMNLNSPAKVEGFK